MDLDFLHKNQVMHILASVAILPTFLDTKLGAQCIKEQSYLL